MWLQPLILPLDTSMKSLTLFLIQRLIRKLNSAIKSPLHPPQSSGCSRPASSLSQPDPDHPGQPPWGSKVSQQLFCAGKPKTWTPNEVSQLSLRLATWESWNRFLLPLVALQWVHSQCVTKYKSRPLSYIHIWFWMFIFHAPFPDLIQPQPQYNSAGTYLQGLQQKPHNWSRLLDVASSCSITNASNAHTLLFASGIDFPVQ